MIKEIKTMGQKLNGIFDEKRADNDIIVNEYYHKAVIELQHYAMNGRTIYYLDSDNYNELYNDDSTIRNLFEEMLLDEELFLYFDTNKYQYAITFRYRKVKYLIEKGL